MLRSKKSWQEIFASWIQLSRNSWFFQVEWNCHEILDFFQVELNCHEVLCQPPPLLAKEVVGEKSWRRPNLRVWARSALKSPCWEEYSATSLEGIFMSRPPQRVTGIDDQAILSPSTTLSFMWTKQNTFLFRSSIALDPLIISSVRPKLFKHRSVYNRYLDDFVDNVLIFERYFNVDNFSNVALCSKFFFLNWRIASLGKNGLCLWKFALTSKNENSRCWISSS